VTITIDQVIIWLIVGAMAGSLVGMLVKRKKEGFGWLKNLGIGLVGAIIGGGIFHIFKIDLGLGKIAVSFEDIISAFVGSLLFAGIMWCGMKYQQRKEEK
jgi:uncharacterized membrane protein YeaQ/YmgE (transglycosylase-associated protein family)